MRKKTIATGIFVLFLALLLPAPSNAQEGGYAYEETVQAYVKEIRSINPNLPHEQAYRIAQRLIQYYYYFEEYVDIRLVMAVIYQESRFNPRALSPKGAMGLGQLMPGTARKMGVSNPYDIEQNIYGTYRYLYEQFVRWYPKYPDSRIYDYVLASYNAGPGAVEKYNGVPPYRETVDYVKRVKDKYRKYLGLN